MDPSAQATTLYVLQIVNGIVQIATLIALIIYVWKTWEMAVATRKSAEATHETLKVMRSQYSVEALSKVLEELGGHQVSEDRAFIRTHNLQPPGKVSSAVFKKLYRVWAPFDKVGLLVDFGLVPDRPVLELYYGTIIECWNTLEPYILHERKMRNGRYLEYFQNLYRRSVEFRDEHYPQDRRGETGAP